MHTKRLSVIIPGYNNPERYWRRCLCSVVENIGPDDEIICVDDGSVQKPEFLSAMAKAEPRIRVIYMPENKGLPTARNVGMDAARGKFVTFVDSDDEVYPDTYANALECAANPDVDIVMFGVRSEWVQEKLQATDIPPNRNYGELDADAVCALYESSILNYAWNKVFRSDFLVSNGLKFNPDGVPCEDIIFVLECIMCRARWATISHLGIKYNRVQGSLLSRHKKTLLRGLKIASDTWSKFNIQYADGRDLRFQPMILTDAQLLRCEWDNIWKFGSPYSLYGRYVFAKQHPEIRNVSAVVFFVRKLIFVFLRRWFYIVPIRRWHIRRVCLSAREM